MQRRIAFAVFALGILFSMIREWRAPSLCIRSVLVISSKTGKH